MVFSTKLYDVLKQVAMIWLPALGTLYFTIAGIWGIPDAENVIGTITAVDTALGAILGLSSKSYKGDGTLVVNGPNLQKALIDLEPEQIAAKKSITLMVEQGTGSPPQT